MFAGHRKCNPDAEVQRGCHCDRSSCGQIYQDQFGSTPIPPPPGNPSEQFEERVLRHAGVELLYLISGKLELIISSDRHVLEEGDAVYFDSAVRHSYRRLGKNRCSAVIVTV